MLLVLQAVGKPEPTQRRNGEGQVKALWSAANTARQKELTSQESE